MADTPRQDPELMLGIMAAAGYFAGHIEWQRAPGGPTPRERRQMRRDQRDAERSARAASRLAAAEAKRGRKKAKRRGGER